MGWKISLVNKHLRDAAEKTQTEKRREKNSRSSCAEQSSSVRPHTAEWRSKSGTAHSVAAVVPWELSPLALCLPGPTLPGPTSSLTQKQRVWMLLRYLIVHRCRSWGGGNSDREITFTVNVKWSNLSREIAKIFIFQLVNFDYFLVKNDYSFVF